MPAPGASRPDRLRACVDQIRQTAEWLEAEGFAWAPAELGGIADEIREHIGVIEPPREPGDDAMSDAYDPTPWANRMGVRALLFGGGDCWHPEAHLSEHHPHPVTGKVVCWTCHPPVVEPIPSLNERSN